MRRSIEFCRAGKSASPCRNYPNVSFDFLGFCFRSRLVLNPRNGMMFGGFTPAVSPTSMKAMRETIRDLNLRRQTPLSLQAIASKLNPLLRGWINYYGRYTPSALSPFLRYVNLTLVAWVDAEVQALQARKTQSEPVLDKARQGKCGTLCTLAIRYGRDVCLMGAV